MSAVAAAVTVGEGTTAPVLAGVPGFESEYEMHMAEQKRWMTWFGIPVLVAAIFVGMTFATGDAWWLGLAIAAIVLDILVLVWLAMSSDTNGVIADPASPGH